MRVRRRRPLTLEAQWESPLQAEIWETPWGQAGVSAPVGTGSQPPGGRPCTAPSLWALSRGSWGSWHLRQDLSLPICGVGCWALALRVWGVGRGPELWQSPASPSGRWSSSSGASPAGLGCWKCSGWQRSLGPHGYPKPQHCALRPSLRWCHQPGPRLRPSPCHSPAGHRGPGQHGGAHVLQSGSGLGP